MTAASAMTVNKNWGISTDEMKTHFDKTLKRLSARFGLGASSGGVKSFLLADPRNFIPDGGHEVGYHEGRVGVILMWQLSDSEMPSTSWFRDRLERIKASFPEGHAWITNARLRYFYPICTASDDGDVVVPFGTGLKGLVENLSEQLYALASQSGPKVSVGRDIDLGALAGEFCGLEGIDFCY